MKDELAHHKALKLAADVQRARQHPRTNADKIRNMTDEELARYILSKAKRCYSCPALNDCNSYNCMKEMKKWLRKEVE